MPLQVVLEDCSQLVFSAGCQKQPSDFLLYTLIQAKYLSKQATGVMINSVELLSKPGTQAPASKARGLVIDRSLALNLAAKRAFDILLAAVSLLCLLPVLLVATLAIVLDSAGSPIFTQLRVGQNGKIFKILKLRTMYMGADRFDYKTRSNDPRLTSVGVWLRRLNIDELPQLFNVLAGDMSIIGPRPLSEAETKVIIHDAGFSPEIPGLIPTMKPGLVGLEQINRTRNLTYAERFRFNCQYESNWSITTDAHILVTAVSQCSPVCIAVMLGAALLTFGVSQLR